MHNCYLAAANLNLRRPYSLTGQSLNRSPIDAIATGHPQDRTIEKPKEPDRLSRLAKLLPNDRIIAAPPSQITVNRRRDLHSIRFPIQQDVQISTSQSFRIII